MAIAIKNPPARTGDRRGAGSILVWGRSSGGGHGNPATSKILAWRIPRTEEPGGLQSMGSQRVMRLGMRALEYDPLSVRVKGVPASPCAEAQPG